ncbi:MAG: hypothetical protein JW779_03695 [Candidatus Thorarchaeota archaeon]|nr:hypothetical protein [Candidatus Thorarchaeota archaeon]
MTSKKRVLEAYFVERPNRFLAKVRVDDSIVDVFVPNPGRMKELMIPGKKFFIRENSAPHRKTNFDLIGVIHDGVLISLDSNLPNRFLRKLLDDHRLPFFQNYSRVVPEPRHYDGRFDFRLEG